MANAKYKLVINGENMTDKDMSEVIRNKFLISRGQSTRKYWFDSAADRETAKKAVEARYPAAEFVEFDPESKAKPKAVKKTKTKNKTEESDGSSV